MTDGHIDRRFLRLRCRRHDRLHCNIPRYRVHRIGTVSARTSWSFDSPLRFRPFQVYFSDPYNFQFLSWFRFLNSQVSFVELTRARQLSVSTLSLPIAFGSPKPASRLARLFRGFALGNKTERNLRCRRADSASVFGRPSRSYRFLLKSDSS